MMDHTENLSSTRSRAHRMHDLFRSNRLVQAVSCTGEEQDNGSKLSLSFAIANVVTAGSTVDSKGATTSPGLAITRRMAELERGFRESGIHVIGIQEASQVLATIFSLLQVRAQPDPSVVGSGSRDVRRMLSLSSWLTLHECLPPISVCSDGGTLRCDVVVCHAAQSKCIGGESCFLRFTREGVACQTGWLIYSVGRCQRPCGRDWHRMRRSPTDPSCVAFTDEHDLVLLDAQWEGRHATWVEM